VNGSGNGNGNVNALALPSTLTSAQPLSLADWGIAVTAEDVDANADADADTGVDAFNVSGGSGADAGSALSAGLVSPNHPLDDKCPLSSLLKSLSKTCVWLTASYARTLLSGSSAHSGEFENYAHRCDDVAHIILFVHPFSPLSGSSAYSDGQQLLRLIICNFALQLKLMLTDLLMSHS
jgi:hypothetical protein